MSVTYKNAPLVELIAELRWGGSTPIAQAPDQPVVFRLALPGTKDEEMYMHLSAIMSRGGYSRLERLLPPGVPLPPTQVACRFRPSDPSDQSPLFQVGPCVFTANALPPYKSWASFAPEVEKGISWLFEAHDRAGLKRPALNLAMTRYIDAFDARLTGGRDVHSFLREVMGLQVLLPPALRELATDTAKIVPTLQFMVPASVGQVRISFAEGNKGNEAAIMMDTTVVIQREIGPDVKRAIAALTEGRQVIHDLFLKLTAPIHELMEPIQ
jgi:uncharacterized protein (TIGR04255 family)